MDDFLICRTLGAIEITASPQGTITTGQVERVTLQCLLQEAGPGDNIQYQWTKDGASVPTGVQINGGGCVQEELLVGDHHSTLCVFLGTLIISGPQPALSGEYSCTAEAQQITGSHQLTIVPGQTHTPKLHPLIKRTLSPSTHRCSWSTKQCPGRGGGRDYNYSLERGSQ